MIHKRLKIRTSLDGSKVWADAKASIGKGEIKCAFDLTQNCLPNCAACQVVTNHENENLENVVCFRGDYFIIGSIDEGTV